MPTGKTYVYRDDNGETHISAPPLRAAMTKIVAPSKANAYVPERGESQFSVEARIAELYGPFQKFITPTRKP